MAAYNYHRLIIGKRTILSHLEKYFTEMFIDYFSTFHLNSVQIPIFDWLPGRNKAYIFAKIF